MPQRMSADSGQPAAGATAPEPVARVALTPKAVALLSELTQLHGPLMFHQSGGCCDGSAPMCYPLGEFRVGGADVRLAELDAGLAQAIPFWMSQSQFEYWSHTHLTVDVVPGRGSGFSVESPTGQRFLIRSRLFTDEESARLPAVVSGG
ncbi:protein of unknown function DUF779 [Nakamurella multipartita DSM 44233]|jgi:uncharacterized protein (DUF779 family)|uniref:UDP-glucose 4-epimerase n=2 Tax=Nakamurella TaxID=53460 RepID=C8XGI7_NAKMY|nr:DUF779 domain-containing protein [Nakamurella multipartita]ACV78170.1 protein of unknown function DUF779 [Nakamurella multipartita DSM 44233]